MNTSAKFLLSCIPLAVVLSVVAEKPAPHGPQGNTAAVALATSDMATAALDWIASLDDAQKAKALFAMDSDERENWHFVPLDRQGLMLKDMRPDQRHLVYGLLGSVLSQEGYRKVSQIMSLEKVLFDLEKQSPKRDTEKYYVCIFGTPSATGTWAWRFEGHHLSMSFTIVDGKHVSLTPSFLGANPGVLQDGARKGLEVLQEEDSLGNDLFNALDEAQKKSATVLDKAPDDVLTAQNRKADRLSPDGLVVDKMTAPQRAILQKLISEYVRRYRAELVDADLAKIESAGWDKVHFGWAGEAVAGKPHYYRVQGPTFLFEYDNTQNNARHPHAVWRQFDGDFGRDLLKDHYEKAHGK